MENLTITLIQSDLYWEDIDRNLSMFKEKINTLKSSETDIILLPEMFSTGFSMNASTLAEDMNGKTINWMKEQAQNINSVIVGSIIIHENDLFYNRLIWMRPDGSYAYYDKRHLFSMGKEDQIYSPGKQKLILTLKGWRICPMICYDLRFPVWARNTEAIDCFLFVANWPEKRITHWDILLKARAIENQSYVVGINRTGKDGQGTLHTGHSAVIDPYGGELLVEKTEESIKTLTLDYGYLQLIRRQYPFLRDADSFQIH